MSFTPNNLSPSQLRKQTFRAGLSALILIATILVICAIFCAIGISRSAESNRIFELVTYQQTVAEKLGKQVVSLQKIESDDAFFDVLEQLEATIEKAKTVQHDITMPNRWGPMDAYSVDVLNDVYRAEPLLLDQRFGQMIGAFAHFVPLAEGGRNTPVSEFTRVLEKTDEFSKYQSKAIKIYFDQIGRVRDQSRWRISLTFLFSFLSLLAIGVFLLNPFSKRIENQAQAVKRVNDKLKVAALRDPLTGLPNRLAVTDHLDRELEFAKTNHNKLGVAHIDLDHFKDVNDKYGHAAGDFMLVEIARRMQAWEGETNLVARFGGDEFVAVMNCQTLPCTFEDRVRTLLRSIEKPMNFQGITLQTTASIGVSIHQASSDNGADLIINADLALYQAKKDGRNRHAVFEPQMRDALEKRKLLESELKTALDKGDILPYFQPQVDLAKNKVTGAEALIRWNHETRGSVSPGEFLPVAESSGLMVRLGRQLMEKAIIEAAKWHAENIPFGRLGLNASASELAEHDFVDWLLATANKHQLPTHMLSIEILETVMFKDSRLELTNTFARLRDLDIHIELDDFGTGYASLQQVKTDKIDRIKIDRGFIKDIDHNHGSAMIVRAMVELAKSLDIAVIAEGAETLSELEALQSIGCYTVQGYGLAKPMPPKAMLDWLGLFVPTGKIENLSKTTANYELPVHKLRLINS